MTLRQLRRLAMQYTPRVTRKARAIRWYWKSSSAEYAWVPAHELAHAFVANPAQLTQLGFGLHDSLECDCPSFTCLVHEAAAMRLSTAWAVACKRWDLVDWELKYTDNLKLIYSPAIQDRAVKRLKRCGLWPEPMTVPQLRAYAETKGLHA